MITAERQTCAVCGGKALLIRVWGAAAKRLPSRSWTECRSPEDQPCVLKSSSVSNATASPGGWIAQAPGTGDSPGVAVVPIS